jgi:hypothetical protein
MSIKCHSIYFEFIIKRIVYKIYYVLTTVWTVYSIYYSINKKKLKDYHLIHSVFVKCGLINDSFIKYNNKSKLKIL